jgi:hypothetical protein
VGALAPLVLPLLLRLLPLEALAPHWCREGAACSRSAGGRASSVRRVASVLLLPCARGDRRLESGVLPTSERLRWHTRTWEQLENRARGFPRVPAFGATSCRGVFELELRFLLGSFVWVVSIWWSE